MEDRELTFERMNRMFDTAIDLCIELNARLERAGLKYRLDLDEIDLDLYPHLNINNLGYGYNRIDIYKTALAKAMYGEFVAI
jgi:hypothetical protein